MPTKPRSEVFRPDVQAVVHLMNTCVRSCFLMGKDKHSKKDNSHRKAWFEGQLEYFARGFAIDLMCYAVMCNHFHIIARSRPDIAAAWSDEEIILQWHKLCPLFKDKLGLSREPTREELDAKSHDSELVAEYRSRLSDLSWYMKLLCQKVAKICNADANQPGKFWNTRFKAVLLLDEAALIACMAYVDLNRIKAELSATLQSSDYTSIKKRLHALVIRPALCKMLAEDVQAPEAELSAVTSVIVGDLPQEIVDAIGEFAPISNQDHDPSADSFSSSSATAAPAQASGDYQPTFHMPDAHLVPIPIDEQRDPIGLHLNQTGLRCSDKGCISMTEQQYIDLLQWLKARLDGQKPEQNREQGQSSSLPATSTQSQHPSPPPILQQLGLDPEIWCKLVSQFEDMFYIAAGMPETIDNHRSCLTGQRFNMPEQARELLST